MLTGSPPHTGGTLMEIVASIASTPPAVPGDAPEELAELAAELLAFEVEARPSDARAVGRRIEEYLRHRDASLLARRAEARLAQLTAIIANDRESMIGEPAYSVFGECRFGFQHALEIWPESPAARRGLARTIEAMVEYELSQDQPRTAESLLAEHPSPPPELAARVHEASRDKEADQARMRALESALDPRTGRKGRFVLAAVLGVLWIAQPLVTGLLDQTGALYATHGSLMVRNVILCALILGLAYYLRGSLKESAINRVLVAAALTAAFGQLVLHGTDAWLGVSVAETTRQQFVIWFTITLAAAVDRVFAVPSLAYAASFVALAAWPELGFYATALGNVVLVLTGVVYTLRARPPDRERHGCGVA